MKKIKTSLNGSQEIYEIDLSSPSLSSLPQDSVFAESINNLPSYEFATEQIDNINQGLKQRPFFRYGANPQNQFCREYGQQACLINWGDEDGLYPGQDLHLTEPILENLANFLNQLTKNKTIQNELLWEAALNAKPGEISIGIENYIKKLANERSAQIKECIIEDLLTQYQLHLLTEEIQSNPQNKPETGSVYIKLKDQEVIYWVHGMKKPASMKREKFKSLYEKEMQAESGSVSYDVNLNAVFEDLAANKKKILCALYTTGKLDSTYKIVNGYQQYISPTQLTITDALTPLGHKNNSTENQRDSTRFYPEHNKAVRQRMLKPIYGFATNLESPDAPNIYRSDNEPLCYFDFMIEYNSEKTKAHRARIITTDKIMTQGLGLRSFKQWQRIDADSIPARIKPQEGSIENRQKEPSPNEFNERFSSKQQIKGLDNINSSQDIQPEKNSIITEELQGNDPVKKLGSFEIISQSLTNQIASEDGFNPLQNSTGNEENSSTETLSPVPNPERVNDKKISENKVPNNNFQDNQSTNSNESSKKPSESNTSINFENGKKEEFNELKLSYDQLCKKFWKAVADFRKSETELQTAKNRLGQGSTITGKIRLWRNKKQIEQEIINKTEEVIRHANELINYREDLKLFSKNNPKVSANDDNIQNFFACPENLKIK